VQDFPWHYVDGTYLAGVHTLKVEYFERAGGARIRFWWEPSATTPMPEGPAPAPAPAPMPGLLGPWQGEYFNSSYLTGTPILRRNDVALNFDWGFGSPASEIKNDYFSARWTGTFSFAAGRYTFTTYSDDGVRLYVDGKRTINSWQAMRGTRSATVDLSAGTHTLQVEYFERTGRAQLRLSVNQVGAPASAAAPQPSSPPMIQPVVVAGGPLRLDAWPVGSYCTSGGWVAIIFVQGHGGDGRYIYSWEGQVKGGPTASSMTFEVRSSGWGTAIVGEVAVTSAGQTAEVELYVPHPVCK
jgi:hypothetical protein